MTARDDLNQIRDELILLSGYLPLFAADRRTVTRATVRLHRRNYALDALDRLASRIDEQPVQRIVGRP